MRRLLGVLIAASVLLAIPQRASAAIEVTLTVSPTMAVVGQRVEVLLRTYVSIGWEGLDLAPPQPWPFVPDLASVLWPVPDYSFTVVAHDDDGAETELVMVLDPSDPTLWRGILIPDDAGTWQVRVTHFPESDPGANVTVEVSSETPVGARSPTPAASGPARVRTPGTRQIPHG